MASQVAHLNETIEVRMGSVAYELVECKRGVFPKHPAIVVVEGTIETPGGLRVLDWPQSAYVLLDSGGTRDGSRAMDKSEYDLMIGWVGSDEVVRLPMANRIVTMARQLLSNTIATIGKPYWRPYPARLRNFSFDGDPRREIEFVGSCVGFVEECYEAGDFDLVCDDESTLPQWTATQLFEVWPLLEIRTRATTAIELAEELNEHDIPVPCGMFFPGYQLASFMFKSYPFMPTSTDDAFIRRA